MKTIGMLLLSLTAILLLTTSCLKSITTPPTTTTSATSTVGIGDLAPDFILEDLNGNSVTLSEMINKIVILNFWSINCHYCTEELPYFQNLFENRSSSIILLTIDRGDSISELNDFIKQNEYSFPVLMDKNNQVSHIYGISNIPVTIFIDTDGLIQVIKIGMYHNVNEIEDDFESIQ